VRRLLCFALLALCALMTPAGAEKLIVSLSSDVVEIRSNFTGAQVALFGSIVPDEGKTARASYDIVATTRGPRGSVTVFEKQKFGPFWLNGERRTLDDVPSFIAIVSNRALDAIAPPDARAAARVGLEALVAPARPTETPLFRDALIRLRADHQLFQESPAGVRFLSPTLFQTAIPVAGTAPLGRYDVDVKVFADGALVAQADATFRVEKVGAEQWLSQTALTYGFGYGVALSLVALFVGWLASLVFRRE
jgi:uncharacterized protein (TIGR02186 family)